eukprot:g51709.t1
MLVHQKNRPLVCFTEISLKSLEHDTKNKSDSKVEFERRYKRAQMEILYEASQLTARRPFLLCLVFLALLWITCRMCGGSTAVKRHKILQRRASDVSMPLRAGFYSPSDHAHDLRYLSCDPASLPGTYTDVPVQGLVVVLPSLAPGGGRALSELCGKLASARFAVRVLELTDTAQCDLSERLVAADLEKEVQRFGQEQALQLQNQQNQAFSSSGESGPSTRKAAHRRNAGKSPREVVKGRNLASGHTQHDSSNDHTKSSAASFPNLPLFLVGEGWGGLVALSAALDQGQFWAGLILAGPPLAPTAFPLSTRWAARVLCSLPFRSCFRSVRLCPLYPFGETLISAEGKIPLAQARTEHEQLEKDQPGYTRTVDCAVNHHKQRLSAHAVGKLMSRQDDVRRRLSQLQVPFMAMAGQEDPCCTDEDLSHLSRLCSSLGVKQKSSLQLAGLRQHIFSSVVEHESEAAWLQQRRGLDVCLEWLEEVRMHWELSLTMSLSE